jgi:hypothetical protein
MNMANAMVDGKCGREYHGCVRLAVLSDTHVSRLSQLPRRLVDGLSGADLIIHLGDCTGKELVDDLRALGDFRGVAGNMDGAAIRAELPDEVILELGGRKLALTHGGGDPQGLRERLETRFRGVDIVLCGHTHQAAQEWVGDVLFFNPGSAAGKFPALRKTYGVIDLGEFVRAEIVEIE